MDGEYLSAAQLEQWTGTKASTWRYWASVNQGPASFRLGKRRVWKRSVVQEWLAAQESA
jgi:prophage regulatory protein